MNIKNHVKNQIINIISKSMQDLPGIKWIIGENPKNIRNKMNELARYAFEIAWRRNGIFISRDRKGLAIMIAQNKRIREKISLFISLRFIFYCTGLKRAWEIFKREKYIHNMHPANKDYLHFWIFAVLPSARGSQTAIELKNTIFKESERLSLPIYLETTLLKNKIVYERFGFKVYHKWQIKKRNITMYFMKKDVLKD